MFIFRHKTQRFHQKYCFIFYSQAISLYKLNIIWVSVATKKILCENLFCVSSIWLITEKMCSWYGPNCYCDRYICFIYNQRISTLQNSNTFCYVLLTGVYAAFSSQEWFQCTHLANGTCMAPRNVCETKVGWKIKAIYLLHSLPQIQLHGYTWGAYLILRRPLTQFLILVFFLLRLRFV